MGLDHCDGMSKFIGEVSVPTSAGYSNDISAHIPVNVPKITNHNTACNSTIDSVITWVQLGVVVHVMGEVQV